MRIQQRFKSASASAKSDQSLSVPSEETLDTWLPIEQPSKTDQTGQNVQADQSLQWAHIPTCTFSFGI